MTDFTNQTRSTPQNCISSLAIVLPTHNRPDLLAACLASLAGAGVFEAGVPVLVCDDGSAPDSARRNEEHCRHFGAQVLFDVQGGPAKARNRGIRAAGGAQWCAFLDDDVAVNPDWYSVLCSVIAGAADDCVGIEGAVHAGGEGLWDREVENREGGAFITANMIWRRSILFAVGMFDEGFTGPYAEDQELSVRMARHGVSRFYPALVVVHATRSIRLFSWLADAHCRINRLLAAELHFWLKNRSRYHMRRASTGFPKFLLREIFLHAYAEIRRRGRGSFILHPLQAAVLAAGALLEQLSIVLAAPGLLHRIVLETRHLPRSIDPEATAVLWGCNSVTPGELLFRYLPFRGALFHLFRWPVYDLRRLQKMMPRPARTGGPAVYLRIDDVFFKDAAAVERLCAVLAEEQVHWLAAVTGDDCQRQEAPGCLDALVRSGARPALHGFSHTGRFGPYQSEMLQLTYREIAEHLAEVRRVLGALPAVFVPPFNGLDREQILFLSGYFTVVCGGPETARFSGLIARPVALAGGGVYFPVFEPCYGTARSLLTGKVIKTVLAEPAPVCIALHMADEAKDDFAALRSLVRILKPYLNDWHTLMCVEERTAI